MTVMSVIGDRIRGMVFRVRPSSGITPGWHGGDRLEPRLTATVEVVTLKNKG